MPSKATARSAPLASNSSQASASPIFALLLALRVTNALLVRTYFQPDEYYQALEPAWQFAHGPDSQAWITWVGCTLRQAIVERRDFAHHFTGVEK
jgi:Alg9-like mannosyltransferase family